MFRALVRRGVQPSEVPRLTHRQAMNILDDSDPDDRFRGAIACDSPQRLWEALGHGI